VIGRLKILKGRIVSTVVAEVQMQDMVPCSLTLHKRGIGRPPREPQTWLASTIVAGGHDVTVGIDADRDADTEESSLVLHLQHQRNRDCND
jgi:hypothetical protein